MTKIAIMNRSTVMTDEAVKKVVDALQIQVSRDFAPIWGVDAALTFVGLKGKAPSGAWQLVVLDTSDQAGALGYHDVTATGQPLGKAFVKSDLDNGYQPSVTISHELLEMLADPEINLSASVGNRLYAYEVCDPCEADQYGYKIGDVLVSDFVTPAWFAPTPHAKGPFDFRKKVKAALHLLSGGYLQCLDIGSTSGWQEVTAERLVPAGSRRARRRAGHGAWALSTAR